MVEGQNNNYTSFLDCTFLEWVAGNDLVLIISKTKSMILGSNHSLNSRLQLNLVMNGVAVEQICGDEMT